VAAVQGRPDLPALGRPRLHIRSTDSTNERARALASAGAPHGTLVTAREQMAGRGRQGRRWIAPPGSSLLMSLVLRDPVPSLPLAAAVAVCDVAGPETLVKWPNDVVVARGDSLAKLAGILVEGRPQESWAVLGIGLNVAMRLEELPEDLRLTAATLGESPAAIEPTLRRLLDALERRLAASLGEVLEAWRARDALLGHEIAWSGGRGRADGIDGTGRLVVREADGRRTTLQAGEVHLYIEGA
jgi:BirA family transcriptional regulator, biotin operon repressor / biotin---[acetyl-CoA-carboxylase] ligase